MLPIVLLSKPLARLIDRDPGARRPDIPERFDPSGPRTTVLEGAVHLLVFFVYLVLMFSP
jgi:hypothetical protein